MFPGFDGIEPLPKPSLLRPSPVLTVVGIVLLHSIRVEQNSASPMPERGADIFKKNCRRASKMLTKFVSCGHKSNIQRREKCAVRR